MLSLIANVLEAEGSFSAASCLAVQPILLEQTLLTLNPRQIPLSWRDAQALLQALRGHGTKVDDNWKGAVPEVDEWWTGDTNSPTVLLQNDQEEIERNSIYNGKALFGVLPFCLRLPYLLRTILQRQNQTATLFSSQTGLTL